MKNLPLQNKKDHLAIKTSIKSTEGEQRTLTIMKIKLIKMMMYQQPELILELCKKL